MLQFVLGRAGSGKTNYLRNKLVKLAKENTGRLMMIVPEQYSFGTEKAILKEAGARDASKIDVVSFTRLAEMVFRIEGGVSGKRLSEGGRRMMMNLAINECIDYLELYAPTAKTGKITDIMLTAVSEMKLCGITEDILESTAKTVTGGVLREKLKELALIFRTYNTLVESSYLDSRDDLTRLGEKLKISDFFKGVTVAVDSFEGFTVQEIRVLSMIMKKADTVIVSLCTDDIPEKGTGLFALVNRTKRKLRAVAKENDVKLAPDILLADNHRFISEDIRLLEKGLFSAEEFETAERVKDIHIYGARDLYEEAEFIGSTIRRLTMEKGYSYSDFTLVCRSPEKYGVILNSTLRKRDIPCFVSLPEKVDAEPLMRVVLSALEISIRGFSTEGILEMLKSGILDFTTEEISQLENYAFIWRLKGSQWRSDFTKSPRGYGSEMDDEIIEELGRINDLRRKIIEPVLKFRSATSKATGISVSHALYDLLMDFGIDETLPEYSEMLEKAGETMLAKKQVRVWELLISILEQMAAILGNRPVTRERYYTLLKDIIRSEDLSEIPGTSDEVIFGTPEQVRQSAPKVLFLMGAVQGEFPAVPHSSGVFSDTERKQLLALDLPFGDPLEQKTIEERYLAYSAACLGSEMLFVSYPKNSSGEETQPSEIVNGIKGVFPGLREISALPAAYFSNSKKAAFSKMAALYNSNTPEAAALKKVFENDEEYSGRIQALRRGADGSAEKLLPESAKDIFGATPYISATQIEKFHSCKFAYYCQYGIKARERRTAQIDAMQYGTIMHFLLEKFFGSSRKNISELDDDALEKAVNEYIKEYADENMGGYDNMDSKELYRFERMKRSAVLLIKHIYMELEQSEFRPEYFELSLDNEGRYPPLKISSPGGNTSYVIGTIDRVDIYNKKGRDGNDERYVRVVDYKTGKKEFKLQDVLHGLNMQMLVYLAALVERGAEFPAGMLYTPLATPSFNIEREANEGDIQQAVDKSLKMNGLVLSDTEIVRAMEEAGAGKFIPAAVNKDGSVKNTPSVVSMSEMGQLLDYSKRLIASMTDSLLSGDIESSPNLKNHNSCEYCPYRPVCGKEYGSADVDKTTMKKEDVFEKIGGGSDVSKMD